MARGCIIQGSGALTPDESYTLVGASMTPSEEYRLIPLTQGQFAKVDASDFEWLSQWKWQAIFDTKKKDYYAVRTAYDGRKRRISMARLILGLGDGDRRIADHINSRETLNNCRSNLRIATFQQNCFNRRLRSDNLSGLKGASFIKKRNLWISRIYVSGKEHKLGLFATAEEAHRAYVEAAERLHGDFARRA